MEQINNNENGGYYFSPPKPERKIFTPDKADYAAAVSALVSAALTVFLGVWGGFNLGWAAAYAVFFITLSVYLIRTALLKSETRGVSPFGAVCGILSLALCLNFVLCADTLIRFLSFIVMLALGSVYFSCLSGRKIPGGDLGLLKFTVFAPFSSVTDLPDNLRSLFIQGDGKGKKTQKALLGIICAVPVLCAVIPLLIRSDAAFEGLVGRFFRNLGETAGKAVLTVIAAPFLISFCLFLRRGKKREGAAAPLKGFDTVFISAFMFTLNACYLVYLLSQTAYFFSAFSGILPDGAMTYAKYARRGFFELCAVCAINLCVFFFMIVLSRSRDGRMPSILRAHGVFLSVFTLVLAATAISKMVMYISRFGMTVDRVFSSAFMIFAAVVFVSMLLRCFSEKVKIFHTAFIAAGLILLVLGAFNADSLTAQYNVAAYYDGRLKTVDTEYLASLGEDGIPLLIGLANDENEALAKQAKISLANVLPCFYTGRYNGIPDDYSGEAVGYSPDPDTLSYFIPDGGKADAEFYKMNLPRYNMYKLADVFIKHSPGFFEETEKLLHPSATEPSFPPDESFLPATAEPSFPSDEEPLPEATEPSPTT